MTDQLSAIIENASATLGERRLYGMNKILVVIDLGNGDVEAKIQQGNKDEWVPVQFPSVVAENASGGFSVNGRQVVVGVEAARHRCQLTGLNDTGKIDNALPLLMYVLQQSVGFDRPLTVDVVFTCPSVKEYKDRIKAQLLGSHTINIAGDALTMTASTTQTVIVGTAVAQLEGHQAHRLAPAAKSGQERYLVDIGNRTVLVTCVDANGGILHKYRAIFNNCGVQSIVERIRLADGLVGLPNAPMMPQAQQVIDYLLDSKFSKEETKKVAAQTAPYVSACLGTVADWLEQRIQPGDAIYLLGGGSKLPGATAVFGKKAKAIKNPTWANVDGLLTVAASLIGAAK